MSMITARAVLFDLDGVLVDSAPVIDRLWRAWAARHELAEESLMALLPGRRAVETVALAAPHLDATAEAIELERVQSTDLDGVRPCPGAVELTRALGSLPWAVVTSGSRPTATARLVFTGITVPEVLITADDVRRGKPDPEGYLAAARRLGVPPQQCVVVEDAEAGAQAARAAGARVVGISGPGLGTAAEWVDLTVASPAELSVRHGHAGEEAVFARRDASAPVRT